MNLERFHSLTKVLNDDIKIFNYASELSNLAGHLQSRNNEPGNPAHGSSADKSITLLREKLPELPSNNFPPAWYKYVTEYRLERLVGSKLLNQIMEIFQRHTLTPTLVASDISELAGQVKTDRQRLAELQAAFSHFGVGFDDPAPGECEMGFWVPRQAIDDEMIEFGEEIIDIGRLVTVFEELATGSSPPPKLRSLSSSDFTFVFSVDPTTCAMMVGAVAALITSFKGILEIRKLIGELKGQNVPGDHLKGVTEHVDKKMEEQITVLTESIMEKANGKIKETRKHELRMQLERGLTHIAVRLDDGYSIEARATPRDQEETDAQAAAGGADATREAAQLDLVLKQQRELNFARPVGSTPVLSLPRPRKKAAEPNRDEGETPKRKRQAKKSES